MAESTSPQHTGGGAGPATAKVRLWDAPVRIVHWALVLLVAFSWWARHDHMDWHRLSGYAILALLAFRIMWGVIGSSNARFGSLFVRPRLVWNYVRNIPRNAYRPVAGHNPLGAWSAVLMFAALLTQIVSGLYAVDVDGIESGPLSDRVDFDTGRWFAYLHGLCFDLLKILILLHISAVFFYLLFKRANLIGPMITGSGRFPGDPEIRFAPLWRALPAIILAAAIAWAAASGFRFG